MASSQQKRGWFRPTPGQTLVGLLVVEGILIVPDFFHWFPRGWAVLIAIAAVGLFLCCMFLWFVACLVFRRRFQFSIRSLMVLTVAVAIPFSWLTAEMKRAQEEKKIQAEIWKIGGSWNDDYMMSTESSRLEKRMRLGNLLGEHFFVNSVRIGLHDSQTTESTLERLEELPTLVELDIGNYQITTASMKHIQRLTNLRLLAMGNTPTTDAELEYLQGMSNLEYLWLDYTPITDGGLVHLKGLTQLRSLNLNGTQITDDGMRQIRGMTKIFSLGLAETQVTDDGLQHLQELKELSYLWLARTKVSDEGVRKLKQILPNCEITR
jgi:hypothetical protein